MIFAVSSVVELSAAFGSASSPEATPERNAELRELLRFRLGLPVDGIQVGIARTDDRIRFKAGEKIPFQIFIRNITQEPIAVLRFSGTLNAKQAKESEAKLRTWMETKGLVSDDSSGLENAGYDPPFTSGSLRRNEVLIQGKG